MGGRVVRWEPFDHEPLRAANRQVFGLDQLPAHDFAGAKYILSFGADFLETWLSNVHYARGFARMLGGPPRIAPFFADHVQPLLSRTLGDTWLIGPLFQGAPTGLGVLTAALGLAS